MTFILLVNVKMPTSVGILTFTSRITTIEFYSKKIKSLISKLEFKINLKIAENTFTKLIKQEVFNFQHFSLYEQLKYHAQLS